MKTDITLSPMVLLKRGVQVAVDCVNNPISNYKFSLLDFNSKTEHNSILKTICNKIDYKVLLNTTYRQIKFFAAELSADITSDAVWATVRRCASGAWRRSPGRLGSKLRPRSYDFYRGRWV